MGVLWHSRLLSFLARGFCLTQDYDDFADYPDSYFLLNFNNN